MPEVPEVPALETKLELGRLETPKLERANQKDQRTVAHPQEEGGPKDFKRLKGQQLQASQLERPVVRNDHL